MTVAQVIGRARVSRKTFYDVFDDREDCFLAAFDQAIAQLGGRSAEAYHGEPAGATASAPACSALLRFMDDEPGLARLVHRRGARRGPRVLERRAQVSSRSRGHRPGPTADRARVARATEESPDVTAEGVVGADLRRAAHAPARARREPLTTLLGPLMSMIVLPYLGPRAPAAS